MVNGTGFPLWSIAFRLKLYAIGKNGRAGEMSDPTNAWTVAQDCDTMTYLNDTNTTLANWKCDACPVGASCTAKTPWNGVVALFGYYRNPSDTIPTTFKKCLFAGACLGAPNLDFQNKYYDHTKTIDLAKRTIGNVTEGCNSDYGFQLETNNNTNRLCHACAHSFRRAGRNECKSCPEDGVNWVLIVVGALIAVALLVVVVSMTIAEAGNTLLSESIQKCVLNYFQVAQLFGGLPLRWPHAMQGYFEFQGVFSTVGQHLVNPDCIASKVPAAELFYGKQIAFLIVPSLMILIVYSFWKGYAMKTKQLWQRAKNQRNTVRTVVTIKDKFVVTVCALLYLFYPTLCLFAFSLFTCINVAGKNYLLADLSEECYAERHTAYVLAIGLPQLLLFVVGLPTAGLFFMIRNRERLDTTAVKARYGLFFGGYKKSRFYWEFFLVVRVFV
jgi:hypothetical protein